MRFPLPLTAKIAAYVIGHKLRGTKKFATVLQLEPLHTCNLTCTGCGRIREYSTSLKDMMSLEDCLGAAKECNAPMVSICGGEPLIYPHIEALVDGLLAQRRIVYICTNAMFMRKKMREWMASQLATRSEFVEMLAARFGLSEAASRSRITLLFELQRMFFTRRSRGETTALVVDEAQSLPSELLEDIRLLANIEPNSEPRMRVVIAGRPELADRLNSAGLQQVKQRISLRCEVRPLGAKETAAYVAGRIRAAGGAGGQVFTREAVELICKHSRGLPRLINVIADNALLGGFASGQRPVGSDIVREICGDCDIQAAPADAGTVAQTMGPPQDVAVLAAERLTTQVVEEPAPSDTPKREALWQPDDREIQDIFFNTYFEKVWSGQQ